MGWKTDTILIRPAYLDAGAEELLNQLGCKGLTPIGESPYEQAIWPSKGTIWVGAAGDCLMISGQGLSDQFFQSPPTAFAQALFRRFPQSEIAAVTLHSVVNLWGFAVFHDGRPIRRRAGSADDGTFEDFGAPLPEEQDMLSKSALRPNGERVYRLPDFPGEDLSEDQVGEEYVFQMYARLAGERPDSSETLLETPCVGFMLSSIGAAPKRPWWRFWG